MGTLFFNPVRYMHLLELIPGEDTLPHFLETAARMDHMLETGNPLGS